VFFVEFLEGVDDGGDGLAVLVGEVEEVDHFADGGVLDHEHVLAEDFKQGEDAALGVEPGVSVELRRARATFFWIGSRDLMMRPTPKS
jgi:hypothetical protein